MEKKTTDIDNGDETERDIYVPGLQDSPDTVDDGGEEDEDEEFDEDEDGDMDEADLEDDEAKDDDDDARK